MVKLVIAALIVCLSNIALANASTKPTSNSILTIGNSQLELIYKSEFSSNEKQRLELWLTNAAKSITTVYGEFPLRKAYIRLHRYVPKQPWASFASGPAPWAFVNRGATPGVTFHVDMAETDEAFIDDWTAYHELSHLLIPYPGNDDLWFSEGLASYYQNITRARSGIISEQVAWQKLYSGLMRGKKDTRKADMTLAELSPQMRETRSFMRVYWSGANYFLSTDLLLREKTQHKQSLDTVLKAFQECCLKQRRRWTGMQIAKTFDEISKTDIFTTEFKKTAGSRALNNFDQSFKALGLTIIDGKVILSENKQAAHSKIMSNSL